MLGDELMLVPVYTQNASWRTVYLPEDMKLVQMRSVSDFTVETMEKGYHYVPAALDEVVFFIRSDRLIPLSYGGECVSQVDFNHLRLLGNVQTAATYQYYNDDGSSKDYENPAHFAEITMSADSRVSAKGDMCLQLESAL